MHTKISSHTARPHYCTMKSVMQTQILHELHQCKEHSNFSIDYLYKQETNKKQLLNRKLIIKINKLF